MATSLKKARAVCDFGKDARRQGQHEREDFVLICPPAKANRRNGKDRYVNVFVLRAYRRRPILVSDAHQHVFLNEHPEREPCEGPDSILIDPESV